MRENILLEIRQIIIEKKLQNTITFDYISWELNDKRTTIYENGEVIVKYCCDWEYLEIVGLTKTEYDSLKDLLDLK